MSNLLLIRIVWFLVVVVANGGCVSKSEAVSLQQKAEAAMIRADRPQHRSGTCTDQEELDRVEELLNVSASSPSASSSSAFEKLSLSLYPTTSSQRYRSRSPISPQRQCWTSPLTADLTDPLEKRTLCPWTWRANVDRKRVPAVILEAQCDCDKFRLQGFPRPSGAPTQIEYACELLTYRMRVMKFVDDDCKEYRIAYEEVPVACIPVKQASRVVNDRQTSIRQLIDSVPRDY